MKINWNVVQAKFQTCWWKVGWHVGKFSSLYFTLAVLIVIAGLSAAWVSIKNHYEGIERAQCKARGGVLFIGERDSVCIDKRFIAPEAK